MMSELAKSSNYLYANRNKFQTSSRHNWLVKFFHNKLVSKIIDIGCKNPLGDRLINKYDVVIDNTDNVDLDIFFFDYPEKYDTVLCLDVLEHLFNPLHCLLEIRKIMKSSARLYVGLPRRGKLLWTDGHFHEIDDYRFQLLAKRADFKIIKTHKYKIWRNLFFYLKGIRPFLRLFFEFGVIYVLEK